MPCVCMIANVVSHPLNNTNRDYYRPFWRHLKRACFRVLKGSLKEASKSYRFGIPFGFWLGCWLFSTSGGGRLQSTTVEDHCDGHGKELVLGPQKRFSSGPRNQKGFSLWLGLGLFAAIFSCSQMGPLLQKSPLIQSFGISGPSWGARPWDKLGLALKLVL